MNQKEHIEFRNKIIKGLDEAYQKLVEFKKQKNGVLVIEKEGQEPTLYQSGELELFARVTGITGDQARQVHLKLANDQHISLPATPEQVGILHQFIPNQDWILLKSHASWTESTDIFVIDPQSLKHVEFVYYNKEDQPQVAQEAEQTLWRYQFSKLSDEDKLKQCANEEQKLKFEEWLES